MLINGMYLLNLNIELFGQKCPCCLQMGMNRGIKTPSIFLWNFQTFYDQFNLSSSILLDVDLFFFSIDFSSTSLVRRCCPSLIVQTFSYIDPSFTCFAYAKKVKRLNPNANVSCEIVFGTKSLVVWQKDFYFLNLRKVETS